MISKETARKIYNCYQQIEVIDKTKKEMIEEIERVREQAKNNPREEPIPENDFGRYGHGLQLGIPEKDSRFNSMRIYNISPELGISVMDAQKKKLEKELKKLGIIARLEMEVNK